MDRIEERLVQLEMLQRDAVNKFIVGMIEGGRNTDLKKAFARRDALRSDIAADWRAREELVTELVEALKVAHDAIKSLPIGCMGEGRDGELVWPIRDEVLDGICATLARVKGEYPQEVE